MQVLARAFDWPHAPVHRLSHAGAYIVTAGTYQKEPFFSGPERLSFLTRNLVSLAQEHGWRLQAWAIFLNHYHFVAEAAHGCSLVQFLRHLHSVSAKFVNNLDSRPGRKIWHQYWDTRITFETSFLARLRYVHTNPVKHGLVANAELYEWCSASWFALTGSRSFQSTVMGFRSDNLAVPDDYQVPKVD